MTIFKLHFPKGTQMRRNVYGIIGNWKFIKKLKSEGKIFTVGNGDAFCFIEDCGNMVGKSKREVIKRQFDNLGGLFGFRDEKNAEELFAQAVGGAGQEWKEINYLKSSTLLAFLTFWDVSDKRPLSINLNEDTYKFSHVKFEMRNSLPGKGGSSNVDVVLWNDNGDVLFLESKFTEYLELSSKIAGLSECRYKNDCDFKRVFSPGWGCVTWNIGDSYDKNGSMVFDIGVSPEEHYIEGVKQMTAHYMGIKRNKGKIPEKLGIGHVRHIFLGEIIYDFSSNGEVGRSVKSYIDLIKPFDDYANLYKILAERLFENGSDITPVREILTYQDIFATRDLRGNAKEFYNRES